MKTNRQDDLVSMTAIVAGAVVSVAVTIGSMILSGDDESLGFTYGAVTSDWVQPAAVPDDSRRDDLGPDGLRWEAIGTYETIETMTSTYPSHSVVDQTLDELGAFALDNPDNAFVQGLYLKALRVSEYYAMEGDDERRAGWLQGRFDLYAPMVMRHESVGLESIRFVIQRLERGCVDGYEERDRLVAVMNRFPDSAEVASMFVEGLESVWSCDAS